MITEQLSTQNRQTHKGHTLGTVEIEYFQNNSKGSKC